VWQDLYAEMGKDHNFTVIAVALDSEPGAAEPWIEQAAPTYPALIDRGHRVAELYNLVNVPQAIWIDEAGHIVRPPEAAGAFDILNRRDPRSNEIPKELLDQRKETRRFYLDAIRDWIVNGEASPYALSDDAIRARFDRPDATILSAHAHFRLGQYLLASGRRAEAEEQLETAKTLHPESWAIWRQASGKLENGIAAGPEFLARVQARAEEHKAYYKPIDMPGIPG
jgi:hypothetical protein